jgi:hypothetical protein
MKLESGLELWGKADKCLVMTYFVLSINSEVVKYFKCLVQVNTII